MNDQLLERIAIALEALAAAKATDDLGFERGGATVLYCNPTQGAWYTLSDPNGSGQRQPIKQPPALKGIIKDLSFIKRMDNANR